MANLPDGTLYGTVVGQFIQAVADSADVDRNPDSLPMSGTITFTPAATRVALPDTVPNPVTMFQKTITATLDSEGYLIGPDGQRGVLLVASDSPGNPTDFTYSVAVSLTGVQTFSFSFFLNAGATIDLTTVIPATSQPGFLTPTDDLVASFVSTPGTKTHDELAQTFAARRVHVVGLWGQSNMSGRGPNFSTFLDPVNSRIWQYGSGATAITPATEPLDMHDVPSGMGPGLQFARQYLQGLNQDDIILLVPSAHGGTPLVSSSVPLSWRWGVNGNLSSQAIQQMQSAISAAATNWPGATVTIDAILWFQGETDGTNNITGTAYRADLDALISGVRTTFNQPSLPFIMGQMIPEALDTGTRREINYEQTNAPYRIPAVGMVLSPPVGYSIGDDLHANSAAHREFYGPGYRDELLRIQSGVAPSHALGKVTLVADDFNRADADTLGSTPIGGRAWTYISGTPDSGRIRSNQAAVAANNTLTIYAVDTGLANGEMEVTLTVPIDTESIIFRMVNGTNYYFLARNNEIDNLWVLWKRVSNSPTIVATTDVIRAPGDVLKVRLNNQSTEVFINGVSEIQYTAAPDAIMNGTMYGFRTNSSLMRLDNFSFSTL